MWASARGAPWDARGPGRVGTGVGGRGTRGRNAPRSSTPPPARSRGDSVKQHLPWICQQSPPPRSRGDSDGKADRYGLFLARLTAMARFSTFSGGKIAKGGVKPQGAKIEAAPRGHKSCHSGQPCHPGAITVSLAIRVLRPSPLPSGSHSRPPCRCDDANARTKKQQELPERGYFAIPVPSISDGELLQGEAPPCHSANALHGGFETQQGNRATKKTGAGYVPTPAFDVAVRAGCPRTNQ